MSSQKQTNEKRLWSEKAPVKIKSALPLPKGFCGHGGFPAERKQKFQTPIKLAHPFPAPEMRTKHFTDTRIFLNHRFGKSVKSVVRNSVVITQAPIYRGGFGIWVT